VPETSDDLPEAHGAAPLVGIILVNWNGWENTRLAYEHVQRSKHENWRFIVVDNASQDESVEKLRQLGPKTVLIESATNLGFAGACNIGISAATEAGAEYVYLLNNDAFVTPDTIGDLVAASRKLGDRSPLGATIRYESGKTLQFWGANRSKTTGLPERFPFSEDAFERAADLLPCDFIMGASLLAHRSIFERVGLLDARFFLNFEETDWCARAQRLGFPPMMLKSAVVYHKGGASIGDPNGPLQLYFMRRNRPLFGERNCPPHQYLMIYLHQVARALLGAVKTAFDRSPSAARRKLLSQADMQATLDYTFRRFGDCPPKIRRMAGEYKALS